MNKKDALDLIKNSAARLLERDGSGKGFICPFCGSGSGANGTGLSSKDGIHYRCWACDAVKNNDLIDIIGKRDKVEGYPARLQHLANLLGISIDEEPRNSHYTHTYTHTHTHTHMKKEKENTPAPSPEPSPTHAEAVETDYTAFYLEAAKNLPETTYTRGLSMETLKRFNAGYCEKWVHPHPKDPSKPQVATPRLIIPTSKSSYLARDTRLFLPKEYERYSKMKVGEVHIFNEEALYSTDKPVIVVEGEIDAMSVEEVGGRAIGLGGATLVGRALTILEEHPPKWIIIALDNDRAGINGSKKLKEGLAKLGILYYEKDIAVGYKDANEALCNSREAFTRAVLAALNAPEEDLKKDVIATLTDGFIERRLALKDAFYPTHIAPLDELLDGGLYEGLYFIGGISSLGKTTFALQVADNIAKHGSDVLFYSLEMSKDELIAKSVSRITYQMAMDRSFNKDKSNAKTTRQLLAGHMYESYSVVEMALIKDALAEYKGKYGQRLYVVKGDGSTGTHQIRERVKMHQIVTGKAPVVVVDYIQKLAPARDGATDKQNIDRAVSDLKRIATDFHTPVIGISSFNRGGYNSPVGYSSFKESGDIEYAADVLIGLQYAGMDYDSERGDASEKKRTANVTELKQKVDEARKTGEPVDIQVKILKSRNGRIGDITLKFLPTFGCFEEPPQNTHSKMIVLPPKKK